MLRFLCSLFATPNPTRDWREDPSVPLLLDLDRHTLGGVGLGEPLARFAFLGPADSDEWVFVFNRKGVSLTVDDDGKVAEITAYFGPAAMARKVNLFAGSFGYRDQPLSLSVRMKERDLAALFGPPYWRDEDENEIILFYEFGERGWQIELTPAGRLKSFSVGGSKFADAEQRVAYGVTKPGPPER